MFWPEFIIHILDPGIKSYLIFPIKDKKVTKWSHSVMSNSLLPHGLQPTRLLRPCDFSRQELLEWGAIAFSEEIPKYIQLFISHLLLLLHYYTRGGIYCITIFNEIIYVSSINIYFVLIVWKMLHEIERQFKKVKVNQTQTLALKTFSGIGFWSKCSWRN